MKPNYRWLIWSTAILLSCLTLWGGRVGYLIAYEWLRPHTIEEYGDKLEKLLATHPKQEVRDGFLKEIQNGNIKLAFGPPMVPEHASAIYTPLPNNDQAFGVDELNLFSPFDNRESLYVSVWHEFQHYLQDKAGKYKVGRQVIDLIIKGGDKAVSTDLQKEVGKMRFETELEAYKAACTFEKELTGKAADICQMDEKAFRREVANWIITEKRKETPIINQGVLEACGEACK